MFFFVYNSSQFAFLVCVFLNALCLIFKIRTDEDPRGLKCSVICHKSFTMYEISSICALYSSQAEYILQRLVILTL